MNIEKIGKFIAKCRKEANLTQKELAQRLNVSEKTVSKWECGIGLPEIFTMLDLCMELGINIIDLLKADGERSWYRYTRVGGSKYDSDDEKYLATPRKIVGDLLGEDVVKIKDVQKANSVTFKVVIKGYNVSEGNTGMHGHFDIEDETGVMAASLSVYGDVLANRLLRRIDVGQVFLMKGNVSLYPKATGGKFLNINKIQKLEENTIL